MPRQFFSLVSWMVIFTLLSACTAQTAIPLVEPTSAPLKITFWSAPNPTQTVYWKAVAEAYMAKHPGVVIEVAPMPESPTSEAGLQAAIAGGTAPAASENIFIGFGQQLASSTALLPLDEMPGWDDLIKTRHMEGTIEGWKYPDGHYYVLPLYSNAMLWGWRIDILKEIGYSQAPRTYSEVYAMGEKLKAKYPEKVVWAASNLAQNTWWMRWFDFFMLYDAASNGKAISMGKEITVDDKAAVEVLRFFSELKQRGLMTVDEAPDAFETGVSVMTTVGPWVFSGWAERFPELKLNESFVLTPPPVPDDYPAGQAIKTFADAKGIAFYRQATPEATAAMWEFVKWALSDEKNDIMWLEKTNLPPARDDLSTNTAFQAYFKEKPELLAYAAELPYAVPPMAVSKFVEIQTAMGDVAIVPVVINQEDAEKAWQAFKEAMAKLLE